MVRVSNSKSLVSFEQQTFGYGKKSSPEVYSDQSKVGAHNPKVPSSSLTPATKTVGFCPAVSIFGKKQNPASETPAEFAEPPGTRTLNLKIESH